LFEIPLSPKPVDGNDEASRLRELILADDRGGAVWRGATPLSADAAAAFVAAMPAARSRTVKGTDHGWDDDAMTAALAQFLRPADRQTRRPIPTRRWPR
jgi:hypothetical protein